MEIHMGLVSDRTSGVAVTTPLDERAVSDREADFRGTLLRRAMREMADGESSRRRSLANTQAASWS